LSKSFNEGVNNLNGLNIKKSSLFGGLKKPALVSFNMFLKILFLPYLLGFMNVLDSCQQTKEARG
jgi:hypothetical protein